MDLPSADSDASSVEPVGAGSRLGAGALGRRESQDSLLEQTSPAASPRPSLAGTGTATQGQV